MDIVTKKQNLLRLWLESFVVVNKSMGKLLKALLGLIVLMALVGTVCAFTVGLYSPITSIIVHLFSLFCGTVIIQVIAAHILQTQQPLMATFSGAVWPSILQIVAGIIVAICFVPVAIIGFFAMKISPLLGGLFFLLFWVLLAIRFLYSFLAIAIDNKGPIEGLIYSWKLTSGTNYLDALLVVLILILSQFLLALVFSIIAFVLRSLIPLYFVNSFDLTHLSPVWWMLGFVLLVVFLFYCLSITTFFVLVFLNRKFQLEPNKVTKEQDDTIFIPLPELETPSQQNHQPTPQPQRPTEGLQSISQAQAPQTAAPSNKTTERPVGGMETLELTKTSVNTSEEDANEITQHLHQVYTPRSKDVVQHTEEDRMPTILFDDDLAQQLEQQFLEERQQPAKEDDSSSGDDSIHLSK